MTHVDINFWPIVQLLILEDQIYLKMLGTLQKKAAFNFMDLDSRTHSNSDKNQINLCFNNAFILEKRTIRLNHIMVDLRRCTVDSNKNSEQSHRRYSPS